MKMKTIERQNDLIWEENKKYVKNLFITQSVTLFLFDFINFWISHFLRCGWVLFTTVYSLTIANLLTLALATHLCANASENLSCGNNKCYSFSLNKKKNDLVSSVFYFVRCFLFGLDPSFFSLVIWRKCTFKMVE